MSTHPLTEILHPKSIAVVGASASGGRGGGFLAPLLKLGFKGPIYPVNPKYPEVMGLKAYPSLKEIPGKVDYVISAVPASQVLGTLKDCAGKGVKCAHLYTARFSETGRPDAAALEADILDQAKKTGIRLIGPNCMGLYHPRLGISFSQSMPRESGAAGLASQSGNMAGEIIGKCTSRGIYFTQAVSYGNAVDLNESDYLEYFARDPNTRIILMYIEGVKDGKRFFHTLRRAASVKPVIIIKGGRGESGARATASHTASLAGSMKIWRSAVAQAGAVSAEHLEELIDLAVSFYFLPPFHGRRVGVAGGAGGASVMAADECEEAGLDVIPLPAELREELREQGIPVWDWVGNPADRSIRADERFTTGYMLRLMAKNPNFDLLISIMRRPHHPHEKGITVDSYLKQFAFDECGNKPLLAVMAERSMGSNDEAWSWELMEETRSRMIADRIPVYPNLDRAARAASRLIDYYRKEEIRVQRARL